MRQTALGKTTVCLIRLYQAILSPDHSFWAKVVFGGGYCQYHPTCSEYTRIAVERYGAARGLLRGCWRILRCNPWSKGGIDSP
jgi:putative membrane protein insertion efficiency factor